jgi:hypothetical protein
MRSHDAAVGFAVLMAGGLIGGGIQVAEAIFGLPNSVSALGAPWLVSAFAVGALVRRPVHAAVAGGALLSTGTALYYAAIVYGYGRDAIHYATVMTLGWGAAAAAAGAAMAAGGALWRGATGTRAALLAAVPAAALAGEAVLLSRVWSGSGAALALAGEAALALFVLVLLSRRRAPVAHVLVCASVLTLGFALAEHEVRGVMRAAGWHGA